MTKFEPTTAQQRMDLLTEVNEFLRDTLIEWARRWRNEVTADAMHLCWQDDGTAVLKVDGLPVMRLTVGIETAIVEYGEAGPRTDLARPMTWGTVPAGWYVQAPDGTWYRTVSSNRVGPVQRVTLEELGAFSRAPRDPVTACPGPPNATDAAIEVLGFPEILKDGS